MKRKMIYGVIAVLLLLVVVILLGPRVEQDTTLKTVVLPPDLDAYLAESEAQFDDIVPGAEKTIIWANEDKRKTEYAVVYLHGFSASRQETAPLSDMVAESLGANLYYNRFTGHGRSGQAMTEATVNSYVNDSYEALEIGRRLGEKVILIGVSTGATAVTWLAQQPNMDDVAAFVLISPNFAPKDGNTELLLAPWGKLLATTLIGAERSWQPYNEKHAEFWTEQYPTEALLPMMGLVNIARNGDFSQVVRPVLLIYSPEDTVINTDIVEDTFNKFATTQKQIVSISSPESPDAHVLAGDILSPNSTSGIAGIITKFVNEVSN